MSQSCQDDTKCLDSDNQSNKILGLWWDKKYDVLTYSLKLNKANAKEFSGEKPPKNRDILSVITSIYDLLGFLSHYLIYPRILLQETWRHKLTWDEYLSSILIEDWQKWICILKDIEPLKLGMNN